MSFFSLLQSYTGYWKDNRKEMAEQRELAKQIQKQYPDAMDYADVKASAEMPKALCTLFGKFELLLIGLAGAVTALGILRVKDAYGYKKIYNSIAPDELNNFAVSNGFKNAKELETYLNHSYNGGSLFNPGGFASERAGELNAQYKTLQSSLTDQAKSMADPYTLTQGDIMIAGAIITAAVAPFVADYVAYKTIIKSARATAVIAKAEELGLKVEPKKPIFGGNKLAQQNK